MKHWDEAIHLARSMKPQGVDLTASALWFSEFILEQQEAAIELSVIAANSVGIARQLTIVQTRCTELLEEVRMLRRQAKERQEALAASIVAGTPPRISDRPCSRSGMCIEQHGHCTKCGLSFTGGALAYLGASETAVSCAHVSPAMLSGGDASKPGAAGRTEWCRQCGALRYEMHEDGQWVWSQWNVPQAHAKTNGAVGAITGVPGLNGAAESYYHLLHRLWTRAVGTPEYVKKDWQRLEGFVVRALKRHPQQEDLAL